MATKHSVADMVIIDRHIQLVIIRNAVISWGEIAVVLRTMSVARRVVINIWDIRNTDWTLNTDFYNDIDHETVFIVDWSRLPRCHDRSQAHIAASSAVTRQKGEEPLLCTTCQPFYALGFAISFHQQMAGNPHESIQTSEAVNKHVWVCAWLVFAHACVCPCGCLLSTLFVSLMKGRHARAKRDACWLRWGSGDWAIGGIWGQGERNGGERAQREARQTDRAEWRREIDEGGAASGAAMAASAC